MANGSSTWTLRDFSYTSQIHGNPEGTLDNKRLIYGDARESIESTYELLSYRCVTAYHQNIMIKNAINGLTDKVIGRGLSLNSIPDYKRLKISESRAKELSDELEYRWKRWCKKYRFQNTQKLVYRGSKISGDSLLFMDYYNKEISPRVVEGRVINPITEEQKNLFNGVYTFLNGDPRALNLWYYDRGRPVQKDITRYGNLSKRLNWILYLKQERPQQLRGLGVAYPILELSTNFGKFMISEVEAARINSLLVGWLKSSTSTAEEVLKPTNVNDYAFAESTVGNTSKRKVDLSPGTIATLEPDEEIQMADVKRPSSTIKDMFETTVHIIAMALDLPYEVVAQKFQSSYSASRAATTQAQSVIEIERAHFSSEVMDPVFYEFVKNEIIHDRLETIGNVKTSEEIELIATCQWQGEAYRSIDPVKEVKANVEMVNNNLVARSDISQKITGEPYDITLSKIKKSNDMLAKAIKNETNVSTETAPTEKVEQVKKEVSKNEK